MALAIRYSTPTPSCARTSTTVAVAEASSMNSTRGGAGARAVARRTTPSSRAASRSPGLRSPASARRKSSRTNTQSGTAPKRAATVNTDTPVVATAVLDAACTSSRCSASTPAAIASMPGRSGAAMVTVKASVPGAGSTATASSPRSANARWAGVKVAAGGTGAPASTPAVRRTSSATSPAFHAPQAAGPVANESASVSAWSRSRVSRSPTAVATAVGDRDTLDLLHALTEADSLATGPAAWGAWKAGLVAELVRRTAGVLAGAPVPPAATLTPAQRALAERGELAVAVEPAPGTDAFTVTMTAPDRPGMLAMAAGVLALNRLDVNAASSTAVATTGVSVFTVVARFGAVPDWVLVREDFRRALAGDLKPGERLAARELGVVRRATALAPAPPRVLFIDDASATATVVEVRAHDGVGVLHRIASAIAASGLDVRTAKVATLGAEVVDTFYVVLPDGTRLTNPTERAALEHEILAALPGGP